MSITPEQFMTWSEPDEEELEPEVWARANLSEWAVAPRQSGKAAAIEMFEALQRIEAKLDAGQQSDALREAYDDLEAKHAELYALLEEIEGILKPSTSKLANTVREAITRWRAPVVPEPETAGAAAHPSHDAPVEEWREYARTVHGVSEGTALDQMNRSQIRSALGIEQPGTPVAASVVHG